MRTMQFEKWHVKACPRANFLSTFFVGNEPPQNGSQLTAERDRGECWEDVRFAQAPQTSTRASCPRVPTVSVRPKTRRNGSVRICDISVYVGPPFLRGMGRREIDRKKSRNATVRSVGKTFGPPRRLRHRRERLVRASPRSASAPKRAEIGA